MSCPVCPGCHEQHTKFTKCTVNSQGSKQYAKDTKHISVDEWDFIRSFGGEMFRNYLLTKHLKKVTACTSKLFQWLHPRRIDECTEESIGKETGKSGAQKSVGKKMAAGKSSIKKQTSGKSPVGKQTSARPIVGKTTTSRAAPTTKFAAASKSTPAKTSAQLTSVKPSPSIPFIQKFNFLDKFEFLPNANLLGSAAASAQSRAYEQSVAGSWFGGGGGELLFPTVAAQAPARGESHEETGRLYRDNFSGVGGEFTRYADWLGQELRHKFARGSGAVEFDSGASPTAAFSPQTYETFEPSGKFGSRDDDFRFKTFPETELHRLFGPDSRPEAYGALDYFATQDAGFRFPEDFTHMDYFARGEAGDFRADGMSRPLTRFGPISHAAEGVMKGIKIFSGDGYTREPIYAMRTGVPKKTMLGPTSHAAEDALKGVEIFGGAGYTREPLYRMPIGMLKETSLGPTRHVTKSAMKGVENFGGAGHTHEPIYAMHSGIPKETSFGPTRHVAEGAKKKLKIFGGTSYTREPIYATRIGVPKQSTAPEGAGKHDCVAGEVGCVAGTKYLDILPQSKRTDTPIALGNTEVIKYLQHSRLPRQGKYIGTALAPSLNDAPKLVDSSRFVDLRFRPRETAAPKYLDYGQGARQVTTFGPRRMEASRFFATTDVPQKRNLEISKYFKKTGAPRTGHLLRFNIEPSTAGTAYLRMRNLEALKHLTPTVRFREGTHAPAPLGTENIAAFKSLIQAGALHPQGTIAPFRLSPRNIEEFKTLVKTGDPQLGNYFREALGQKNVAALKYLVQTCQLRQGNIVGIGGGGKSAYSRRLDSQAKEEVTDAARSDEEVDLECAADSERDKTIAQQPSTKDAAAYKNLQRTIAPIRAPKDLDYGGDGDFKRTRHRRPSPWRVPFTYTKFPAYSGMQSAKLPRPIRVFDRRQPVEGAEHARTTMYPRYTRTLRIRTVPDYRYQAALPQLWRTISPHRANVIDRRADADHLGEPRHVGHHARSPQRGPFTYTRFPAYVSQLQRKLRQPLPRASPAGAKPKLPRGYQHIRIPSLTRYQRRSSRTSGDVGPRKPFRNLTPTDFGREVSQARHVRKYHYSQNIGDTDYGGHRRTKAYRLVQSPFKTTKFAPYMGQDIEPSNIINKAGPQGTAPLGTGPYGGGPYSTGPYGTGPYGTGPHGTGPYGGGPYSTGPYGTGPYGTGPHGIGPYGGGPYSNGPYGTGPYGTGQYGTDPHDVGAATKYRRETSVQHSKHTIGSKDMILPSIKRTYIVDEGYRGRRYEPDANYFGSMNYGVDDLYQYERALLEMEGQREREKEKEKIETFLKELNLFYNIINKPDLEAELSNDEDEFPLNYHNDPDERTKEQKKLTLREIVELLRSGNKARFHPVVYHEPFSKKKPWTWMQNFPTKIPPEYLRHLSDNTFTALKAWQRQQGLLVERANGKARDSRKKKSK